MSNPLAPGPALLCKLASITVHADEYRSSDGHEFDRIAFDAALDDAEVTEWIAAMTALAMAPRKREA